MTTPTPKISTDDIDDKFAQIDQRLDVMDARLTAHDAVLADYGARITVLERTAPPVPVDPVAARDKLVYGKYLANHPDVVGLLPGKDYRDFDNIYPTGSNYWVTLTDPGPYENVIIWGECRMQSQMMPKFKNVIWAGRRPETYGVVNPDGTFNGNLSGVIRCYGTGYYQWFAQDSLIDPGIWMDPDVKRPGGLPPTNLETWRMHLSASAGVHGGRGTLKRVEIRNVQDGYQFVQAKASADDTSFTLLEGVWLHANVYYNGPKWVNTKDGSHSDGIQTAVGPNLTVRGSYIGGKRDTKGYSSVPAYNSGDDAWNTELMLQQQRSVSTADKIENVLIEKTVFEGGTYGINHYYDTRYPNLFETTAIKDNLFVRRADGKYVIRSKQFASRYSNNRVIDVAANGRDFTVGEEITYAGG